MNESIIDDAPDAPVATVVAEPTDDALPRLFPEAAPEQPQGTCSFWQCSACGHKWQPVLTLHGCGCTAQQPVLLAQMALCPMCNEQPASLTLAVEVTTEQMGLPRRCLGESGLSYRASMVIERPVPADPPERTQPVQLELPFDEAANG